MGISTDSLLFQILVVGAIAVLVYEGRHLIASAVRPYVRPAGPSTLPAESPTPARRERVVVAAPPAETPERVAARSGEEPQRVDITTVTYRPSRQIQGESRRLPGFVLIAALLVVVGLLLYWRSRRRAWLAVQGTGSEDDH